MKEFVRAIVRRCGYEVTRYAPDTNHMARLVRCLGDREIATVIDVGANVGQFAGSLRRAGFRGCILSIEPQMDAHATLLATAANDPLNKWHVLPRVAVGDRDSTLDLHIAGNSWSTSLLPMLDSHANALPSSREVGLERIPVKRLDGLLESAGVNATPPFMIKMDVQGYESAVLRGASGLLPDARLILTEMSLVPLYDGQTLWRELYDQIISHGFELFDVQPGFADPTTGRLLQMDGLFARCR